MPRDDINYKVAMSTGAKELAAGQLRKAEEQFRFAVKRCPECAGGYRGLAKVFVELEDQPSALEALRDGAQALARAGDRDEAIELLRDAVRLAPDDLTLHRRYAAALANAGNEYAAVDEYDRYVSLAVGRGAVDRARIEVSYAREALGDLPSLRFIEDRIPGPVPARVAPQPTAPVSEPMPQTSVSDQAFEELVRRAVDPRERALLLEARAQELLARRDPLAATIAVEAARALIGLGLQHAAADLLLQVVATGISGRDAQRLLVDVARTLGRGEIARDKCLLLAEALRLEGRPDAATEVERLAAV